VAFFCDLVDRFALSPHAVRFTRDSLDLVIVVAALEFLLRLSNERLHLRILFGEALGLHVPAHSVENAVAVEK